MRVFWWTEEPSIPSSGARSEVRPRQQTRNPRLNIENEAGKISMGCTA